MLNFQAPTIQNLIKQKKWLELNAFNKIKAVYEFVQNEIKFGYNSNDELTATEVLKDGYGQCNTKSTLLMTLLRAVGVPCQIHGFEVSNGFQKGVMTGLVSVLAPKTIIHTWTEVYYNNQWLALEGVITDQQYLAAVKAKFADVTGKFALYAVATNNLATLNIDWKANDTYVQNAAIVKDYGTFISPDVFFAEHPQNIGKIKSLMYDLIGRKIMNHNVKQLRNHYLNNKLK